MTRRALVFIVGGLGLLLAVVGLGLREAAPLRVAATVVQPDQVELSVTNLSLRPQVVWLGGGSCSNTPWKCLSASVVLLGQGGPATKLCQEHCQHQTLLPPGATARRRFTLLCQGEAPKSLVVFQLTQPGGHSFSTTASF